MRKIILIVAAGFIVSSCTKDFKEINKDPNRTANALPQALLSPSLWDVVTRNNTRALRLNNELMQDHVTVSDGDEIHRYIIRPGESDYMWNNWYLQLTNFKDMYERAVFLKNNTYTGIALICDVLVSSYLTDTFGDVPYFEANKGKELSFNPRFDRQETIYRSFFDKLEKANEMLKSPTVLQPDQVILDPLYGRNGSLYSDVPAHWRRFGNSLYLRLLLRASGANPTEFGTKISEIVSNSANYPIFQNNEQSAVIRYTMTPPYVSAFYNYRAFDFSGDNGLSQFFINNLNAWNDPRIDIWATKFAGAYQGIPSGYPKGQVPERASAYNNVLMNHPLLGNIMNYAELQFILAEAALKGYITASPKTYYDNGVKAAITFWGITYPDDVVPTPATKYLDNPDLAWNDAETLEQKMEKIHVQKYYTLFFTDFQQWFEYRRTGYPELPKGFGLSNDGKMPSRLKYPVSVQSFNFQNYTDAVAIQGPDDLNTKVWWNK